MNKVIGLGVVFGSAVAIWACSSSSSKAPSDNGGDDGGGNTQQDSGNPSNGDGATASCSQSDLNTYLSQYGFDGGLEGDTGTTGACVKSMCSTETSACSTEDCNTCGTAVAQCALAKCITFDASLPPPPADAATSCDAPGPQCGALSGCCSEISAAAGIFTQLQSYATMCTTNAASCDEATCKATIAGVNQLGSAFNMPMLCKGP